MAIAPLSAVRCSSTRLSHARGLLPIRSAMRIEWLLLGALLVPASWALVLPVSVALTLLPLAGRSLGLARWLAAHRVRQ